MTMKEDSCSIPSDRLDVFLREFGHRVSAASEAHPCVRCWKRSDLISVISAIIKENLAELKSTFPPAIRLIEQLEAIGWLSPIAVIQNKGSPLASKFFLVDMEAGNSPLIDPFELLMASYPNGVVSYFSALGFHGLTTHTPAFYHIGLVKPSNKNTASGWELEDARTGEKPVRDPLGTALYSFSDKVYYSTKREESTVPGIQIRVMSPRSWIRITTKEQTLLDTLVQPMKCGGAAVVLEAWDTIGDSLDEDRLLKYCQKINKPDLSRRLGSMFELLGRNIELLGLKEYLDSFHDQVRAMPDGFEAIPLLDGYTSSSNINSWRVALP